jgi:hypothetical protein
MQGGFELNVASTFETTALAGEVEKTAGGPDRKGGCKIAVPRRFPVRRATINSCSGVPAGSAFVLRTSTCFREGVARILRFWTARPSRCHNFALSDLLADYVATLSRSVTSQTVARRTAPVG